MLTRLAIGLAWLLHFLPLRVLNPIGQAGGLLFLLLGPSRRQVARTNLRLCFPDWSEAERERALRGHFRAFGRAVFEAFIVWWGSESRVRALVTIEGEEHLAKVGARPRVVFAPHFVGLEQCGLRLSLDCVDASVYGQQKNRVFNEFLLARRRRFGARLHARRGAVKHMIRALREGRTLHLMPDMDLGSRDAVFLPFFGVPTATVTVLPRICEVSGAVVIPAVVTQLPGAQGYRVRFFPAWEDYPSGDIEKDTLRMNTFLEARIREHPEQYFWTHRRFKTRPHGETSLYPR